MTVTAGPSCAGCGRPLGPLARSNKQFCSGACKARTYRRRRAARPARPIADPVLTAEQQAVLDDAVSEPRLVALIARSASREWRAAAWLLERRFPERWSVGAARDELPPARVLDDPFREVDELADRRRRKPDGYQSAENAPVARGYREGATARWVHTLRRGAGGYLGPSR